MKKEQGIEKYYSGDDAWAGFVSVCNPEWKRCDFQQVLVDRLGGNEELAKVVYYRQPNQSCLTWIDQSIPALAGESISHCIQIGRENRVREMLLRMP